MTSSKTQYNVALRGDAMLTSSRWNKGTAFTMAERKAFGLTGRLPYRVNTLDEQCQRAYDQLQARDSPLRKNSFLQSLKNQNWVLYFALLSRHLSELVPVIYTPTEVSVPDLHTSGACHVVSIRGNSNYLVFVWSSISPTQPAASPVRERQRRAQLSAFSKLRATREHGMMRFYSVIHHC